MNFLPAMSSSQRFAAIFLSARRKPEYFSVSVAMAQEASSLGEGPAAGLGLVGVCLVGQGQGVY